jgi:hypothetical protein
MDSNNLNGLVEKADRLRREEGKRNSRGPGIWQRITRRWNSWKNRPISPESFRVYWAIAPAGVMGYWTLGFWMPLVIAIAIRLSGEPTGTTGYVILGFLVLSGLCALVILSRYLRVFLGYPFYLTRRKNIPFVLNGWERLFETPHHLSKYYWRLEASIKIDFRPEAAQEEKTIDAILYLFEKEANGWIYDTDTPVGGFSGDPRKPWKRMGNELHGSVNVGMITEIYRLLNQLAALQRKHAVIASVTINPGRGDVEVDPIHYTGNV